MKNEIWVLSPSLPEYQVSSFGRVRRIPYRSPMPYGGAREYGGQPHYGCWSYAKKGQPSGYMKFVFRKKNYKIHQLICEAFHGAPPFDGAVCMHLDENAKNNRPENLQWGTRKENMNAPKFLAWCRSRTGKNNPQAIAKRKRALENSLQSSSPTAADRGRLALSPLPGSAGEAPEVQMDC